MLGVSNNHDTNGLWSTLDNMSLTYVHSSRPQAKYSLHDIPRIVFAGPAVDTRSGEDL